MDGMIRGLNHSRDKRLFCLKYPDQLWSPHSLLVCIPELSPRVK
jgi:hypothetical protein